MNYKLSDKEKQILEIKAKKSDHDFSVAGIRLIDNPIKNEAFKDKRYFRYVDKIQDALLKKLGVCSSLETRDNIYNVGLQMALTKLAYEIGTICPEFKEKLDKYYVCTKYDIYQVITPNKATGLFLENEIFASKAVDISVNYIYENQYDNVYLRIAEKEFKNVIDIFLTSIYVDIDDKDKFMISYTSYIPDEVGMNLFLKSYLDRIYDGVVMQIAFDTLQESIEKPLKAQQEKLVELNKIYSNKLIEMNKLLEEEKAKGKDFLPTLIRLQKEAEEGTKEQEEVYQEHLTEKNREIKRLEKKIDQLTAKLESILPEEEFKAEIQEETKECDTTLRYAFIMKPFEELENQLLETFPNSYIVSSSDMFNCANTDYAIFITKHLKHNMYYKIKDMCKTHKISYMHFANKNIDILKQEIAKNYEK